MGTDQLLSSEKDILALKAEKLLSAFLDRSRQSALGALVQGIVHNLNGSLQILSMQMELLQAIMSKEEGRINPAFSEKVAKCLEHMDKMKLLVDVLQQKAAHEEQDGLQEIELNDLLEESLSLLYHNLVFKHHVKVKKNFSASLPQLKGQYMAFSEGFSGLISNAIEAMEEAPDKELTLTTEAVEGVVKVRVQDTGCGIGEEAKPSLFSPFFTTKGEKHFGLGLFVTKRLLSPYGASFDFTSRKGETVFTVTFPRQADQKKGK